MIVAREAPPHVVSDTGGVRRAPRSLSVDVNDVSGTLRMPSAACLAVFGCLWDVWPASTTLCRVGLDPPVANGTEHSIPAWMTVSRPGRLGNRNMLRKIRELGGEAQLMNRFACHFATTLEFSKDVNEDVIYGWYDVNFEVNLAESFEAYESALGNLEFYYEVGEEVCDTAHEAAFAQARAAFQLDRRLKCGEPASVIKKEIIELGIFDLQSEIWKESSLVINAAKADGFTESDDVIRMVANPDCEVALKDRISWDRESRKLIVDDCLVREFGAQASRQLSIVQGLADADWVGRIRHGLRPSLADSTVKNLNKDCKPLRFSVFSRNYISLHILD